MAFVIVIRDIPVTCDNRLTPPRPRSRALSATNQRACASFSVDSTLPQRRSSAVSRAPIDRERTLHPNSVQVISLVPLRGRCEIRNYELGIQNFSVEFLIPNSEFLISLRAIRAAIAIALLIASVAL